MKKSFAILVLAAALSQSCAQKISDAIGSTAADFSGKNLETKEFSLSISAKLRLRRPSK